MQIEDIIIKGKYSVETTNTNNNPRELLRQAALLELERGNFSAAKDITSIPNNHYTRQ